MLSSFGWAVVDTGARRQLTTSTLAAESPSAMIISSTLYRQYADRAIGDLIRHFWEGDSRTGRIVSSWHGYSGSVGALPDRRGSLWEAGTLYNVLFWYDQLTHSIDIRQRLESEWNYLKTSFNVMELVECGFQSHANWASDDTGMDALTYLQAYSVTVDPIALNCAKGAVRCAFRRWKDDDLGGGVWYNDKRQVKSLYQTELVLAALAVQSLTGEAEFKRNALDSYEWIEDHLLRTDGLYWVNLARTGPVGVDRPDDIHIASSVTFLGGNMAMAVIHARLYRQTGNDEYRRRAIRTAEGILAKEVTREGVFLDDRDAWVDGYFACDWVRYVVSLRGMPPLAAEVVRKTAVAIGTQDRTAEGFYGGDWTGPAVPTQSVWGQHWTMPQQVMTSASAAGIIVAAALLHPVPARER